MTTQVKELEEEPSEQAHRKQTLDWVAKDLYIRIRKLK